MTEEELLKLKKDIDQAKEKISNLKGQEQSILQQLKDEWDCDNKEDLNKKIKKLKADYDNLNKKVKEKIEELENNYDI